MILFFVLFFCLFCISSKSFILMGSIFCICISFLIWQISSSVTVFMFMITFLSGLLIPLIFMVAISSSRGMFTHLYWLLSLFLVFCFYMKPSFFMTIFNNKISFVFLYSSFLTFIVSIFIFLLFLLLSCSLLLSNKPFRIL